MIALAQQRFMISYGSADIIDKRQSMKQNAQGLKRTFCGIQYFDIKTALRPLVYNADYHGRDTSVMVSTSPITNPTDTSISGAAMLFPRCHCVGDSLRKRCAYLVPHGVLEIFLEFHISWLGGRSFECILQV